MKTTNKYHTNSEFRAGYNAYLQAMYPSITHFTTLIKDGKSQDFVEGFMCAQANCAADGDM